MIKIPEILKNIRESNALKLYLVAVVLFFSGFLWSEWNGFRIRGDDADSKELHGTPGAHRSHSRNHFYHK